MLKRRSNHLIAIGTGIVVLFVDASGESSAGATNPPPRFIIELQLRRIGSMSHPTRNETAIARWLETNSSFNARGIEPARLAGVPASETRTSSYPIIGSFLVHVVTAGNVGARGSSAEELGREGSSGRHLFIPVHPFGCFGSLAV